MQKETNKILNYSEFAPKHLPLLCVFYVSLESVDVHRLLFHLRLIGLRQERTLYEKALVPKNEFGMFADSKGVAKVDSLTVAEAFGKDHRNVIRDIRNLDCSEEFRLLNFEQSSYANLQGKKQPCYNLTRDGFVFLVMGYRGKKAAAFKEAYIRRFNKMEEFIKYLLEARMDFPLLTANIQLIKENPRPYHFSNECNMLNRIVLGKTAKEVREEHGLKKGTSIRPYLTNEEIEAIDQLQRVDIGLLISTPDFQQRKQYLEWYYMKKFQ